MPDAPHPVEAVKEGAREAEEGRSPRTPLIAFTGVTMVVGLVFAVVVTIALVVYYVV